MRYFDPVGSVFLSVDPVVKHHESPYAWNTNNPISFSDPTGADSHERVKGLAHLQKFIKDNKTARKVDENGEPLQHPYTVKQVHQTLRTKHQIVEEPFEAVLSHFWR